MNLKHNTDWKTNMRADAYRCLVSDFPNILLVAFQRDGTTVAEWIGEDIAQISGYTAAELEADPSHWFGIVHPEDRDKLLGMYRRVAEGQHIGEEYRIYRKDGQIRWIADIGTSASVGEDGLFRSIRCLTDISYTKSAEYLNVDFNANIDQTVSESMVSGWSLIKNLDAVVFRVTKEMHPLALVGNIEKLIGYSEDEFKNHPSLLRESIHPDDMAKLWKNLRETEALRVPRSIEIRIRHRTGTTKWLHSILTPVFDKKGTLLFFDGVSLDITDRILAEQAHREAEAKYRSLVDSLDAVIFRLDPKGVPIAIYGNVFEISGYKISELMRDPTIWKKWVHPEDIERVLVTYREISATGERRAVEHRLVRKSGEPRWLRTHIAPRYDEQGNFICYDGIGIDVSESVAVKQREAGQTMRMCALTELSQALASSLDVQQILDITTKQVCSTLSCTCIGITVSPSVNQVQHVSACCVDHCANKYFIEAAAGINISVEKIFESRGVGPRIVEDIADIPNLSDILEKCTAPHPLGSVAIAPLTAGPDVVGAIISIRPHEQEFDRDAFWFFNEVASHASAALTTASLYSQQANIAENLQRSLIPLEPVVDNLDIATLYAPAPGESQVGGDFFDVFCVSDDTVALVVGDVSGKGFKAAIHTAEAKYMLRAFAHIDPAPLSAITRLNEALYNYLPDDIFITLVYMLIEPSKHSITYVNAGHEVCIVRSGKYNSLHELLPTGQMLGVTQCALYKAAQVLLLTGDALFCYTDGITDVSSNGTRFGYDALCNVISEAPAYDSKAILEYVMDKVHKFGAARQMDDQVALVVRNLV